MIAYKQLQRPLNNKTCPYSPTFRTLSFSSTVAMAKIWHWSLGNGPGVKELDLQRALNHGGISIHSVAPEWVRDHPGQGINRQRLFEKFKTTAKPGDRINLFCAGRVRAYGTFTGNIFRISDEEAYWMAASKGGAERNDGLDTGSFKAMVCDWVLFDDPKPGVGRRDTLYEVTEGMKNYENYQ